VVWARLDAAGNFIFETCDRAELFSVLISHAALAASGRTQTRRLSYGCGQPRQFFRGVARSVKADARELAKIGRSPAGPGEPAQIRGVCPGGCPS